MSAATANARQAQMAAVTQSGLHREIDRMEGLIGALSVAASGVASSIECGEALNAEHVDRLFGLLLAELSDNQQKLSRLI